MAKNLKLRTVRRDPLDAQKLAEALVTLADHLSKQLPETKTVPPVTNTNVQSAHE